MIIIAAIDDSPIASTVLSMARRVAALFGSEVDAVHVRTAGSGAVAAATAEAARLPLRVLDGEVVEALATAIRDRNAIALVIGSRGAAGGATPAGHTALEVMRSLDCTVVVVSPGARQRPLLRVLVAVEGMGESAGLRRLFEHLGDRPLPEVIALHFIERAALPPFADSPVLETDAFERELQIRAARGIVMDPAAIRFEIRVGDPGESIRAALRDLDADLVVLAWHRNLADGHGRLVREMLEHGSPPVALLALDDAVPS